MTKRPWIVRMKRSGLVVHSSETQEGAERWRKNIVGDLAEVEQR